MNDSDIPTTIFLVGAVKDYALENYSNGWDVVVETLSDDEIADVIAKATTVMGAKRAMSRHITPRNDYKRDIRGYADLDDNGVPQDLVNMLRF